MSEMRITETDIDWAAEIAAADEQAEHDRHEQEAEEAARRFFCVPRNWRY